MYPTFSEDNSTSVNPLLSVLSDISTGAYTSNVPKPTPLLQHFALTRSYLIGPLIDNAWRERHSRYSNFAFLDSPEPPPAFRDTVIKETFQALTSQEVEKLTKEVELEWQMKSKQYQREICEKYGTIDMKRYSLSSLQPFLVALQHLPGQRMLRLIYSSRL